MPIYRSEFAHSESPIIQVYLTGTVTKYKAQLVAKGYNQKDGVNFHDSFSLVAKTVTVKLLLALTSANNWYLQPFDVTNVFLYGDLEEDIYKHPLEVYTKTTIIMYVVLIKVCMD